MAVTAAGKVAEPMATEEGMAAALMVERTAGMRVLDGMEVVPA